jgi:hypothetical protein
MLSSKNVGSSGNAAQGPPLQVTLILSGVISWTLQSLLLKAISRNDGGVFGTATESPVWSTCTGGE